MFICVGSIRSIKMSSARRVSLRNRKSLKINGKIECTSCKRLYFPLEDSDDEDDQKSKICCDCEEIKHEEPQPQPKRQRKNYVKATAIKQEKLDTNEIVAQTIVNHDQYSLDSKNTIEKENTQTHGRNLMAACMVQIHSVELLSPASNIKRPQLVKLKKEKTDDSPVNTAYPERGSTRALRNKTNVIKEEQISTKTKDAIEDVNEDVIEDVQVKPEHVITKDDTEDSLREKFPGVNQFEFEFLMFLKSKSVSK